MDMLFWLQEAAPAGPPPAQPQGQPTTTQPPKGSEGGDSSQQQQQSGGGAFGQLLIPLVLMFVVMYFLMMRPQKRQQQQHDQMIANLKKNDHVVTSSGIYGIVKAVQDKDLILAIDENKDVRVRVAKSAIAGLVKSSGAESEKKTETPAQG